MRGSPLAVIVALVCACGPRPTDRPPQRVTSVDQLIAAVPDSGMKARWRDAAAKGQLPDLSTLPVPSRLVDVRRPIRVSDTTTQQPARPVIPEKSIAALIPYSTQPVADYRGAFLVTAADERRVDGTLDGRAAPLELHYKLPGGDALATVASGARLRLRLLDGVEDASQRRVVVLTDSSRSPVLVAVSDGGDRPYERRFEETPLAIRQNAPGRDQRSTVTFSLGGTSVTLRPGERGQLVSGGRRFGAFVLASYWSDAKNESREGDAYHVMAMLWSAR